MTIPPSSPRGVDDDAGIEHQAAAPNNDAEKASARRRTAQRVLDLLTAEVREQDMLRWDKATPYLLRHAAEHAVDAGSLHTLLDDWEFLVHADPRGILTAADGADHRTPLTVYRTSLPRHIAAPAPERRHILAVDAVRHHQPAISHLLYNPPFKDSSPWRCIWSTAANISPALRASLTGHRMPVRHLAVGTVDNEPVAITAGLDETARLFHATTGTLHHAWNGHRGGVTALAFHDKHERAAVVTADASGRLRRWDARTGRLTAVIDAHDGPVTGLLTLRLKDQLCALSTGHDGTLRVTDFDQRQTRLLLTTGLSPLPGILAVTGPSDAPIGLAATGYHPGEPGHVVAVDLLDGHVRYQLSFPTTLTGLDCFEADGLPTAVATTADGTGQLWHASNGEVLHDLNRTGRPGDLNVLHLTSTDEPNGTRHVAVTGGRDGVVRIWDLDTARQLHRLEGHHTAVLALNTVHDPHLRLGDASPELGENALDQHALRLLTRAAADHYGFQRRDALAGLIVLSASADETIRSWHALDGKEIRTYTGHTGPVRCVAAFEPAAASDRLWAVSCSDDATGRTWDLTDSTGHTTSAAHPGRIDALATATLYGQPLTVTTCRDSRLRVLDTRTGSLLSARIAGDNPAQAVTLGATREGPVCATASPDKGIVVRLVTTGTVLWQRQTDVPVVALQAGGSMRRPVLLTLDDNGETHMWELATGRTRTGPLCRQTGVNAIATGRIRNTPVAVTGHLTGEILLWNLASGTLRRTMCRPGQAPSVRELSFATGPSGPRVASQHMHLNHHSIRVTDADTGRLCSVISLSPAAYPTTEFALGRVQDVAVVATGGPDNSVRLWDADTGDSHAVLWLPDTVHALDFDDHLLTVAYGRELAAFAPAALSDATDTADASRSPSRQARLPSRRNPNKSLLQTTILRLLLEWEGYNLAPLASLLCCHVPTKAVKVAIRLLLRDGLILPTSKDPLGYALEPKGRALARPFPPTPRTPRPSKASHGGTPVLKLRGWHGQPCGLCSHRKIRTPPGGP
ncbi:WD40 repeat domain-containing protein [Streptomyces sp. NPDC093970]|uniref:WD40 repeat domain-containing protein n=1 Tax=Streptomyces sp. NPDC093970 TaxID=3155076 RepID=UPI00344895F0